MVLQMMCVTYLVYRDSQSKKKSIFVASCTDAPNIDLVNARIYGARNGLR